MDHNLKCYIKVRRVGRKSIPRKVFRRMEIYGYPNITPKVKSKSASVRYVRNGAV